MSLHVLGWCHGMSPLPNLSPTNVLQQSMRENKEKQALSDLMIKPVQRIPRYELLVKVGGVALG